jgi:hypothetical protein
MIEGLVQRTLSLHFLLVSTEGERCFVGEILDSCLVFCETLGLEIKAGSRAMSNIGSGDMSSELALRSFSK